MTNGTVPERGEVEWQVDEVTYRLVLPLRQLRALDKELSCGGVLKMLAPGTRGVFDAQIEDVEKILRYGLVGGGNKMDAEEFMTLWDKQGMMEMVTICDRLLTATLKGPDKPVKDEKVPLAESPPVD